jgi:hypothetical protein
MEYDMKLILEFAKANIPLFEEKYEIFLAKPEDLIGKKVVSIRSGFSNSGGGQVMLIDKIETYGNTPESIKPELQIHLIPCEESILRDDERSYHRGWGCRYSERASSFIFYRQKK